MGNYLYTPTDEISPADLTPEAVAKFKKRFAAAARDAKVSQSELAYTIRKWRAEQLQLAKLQEGHVMLQKDQRDAKVVIAEQRKKTEEQRLRLEVVEREARDHSSKLAQCEALLTGAFRALNYFSEAKQELEEDVEGLEDVMDDLESMLRMTNKKIAEVDDVRHERDRLKASLAVLTQKNHIAVEQIKHLLGQDKLVQEQTDARLVDLQATVQGLVAKLTDLEKKNAFLEDQNQLLEKELHTKNELMGQHKSVRAKKQLSALRGKIRRLKENRDDDIKQLAKTMITSVPLVAKQKIIRQTLSYVDNVVGQED